MVKYICKRVIVYTFPRPIHNRWKFKATLHCNDLLALLFEMVFEMSQSLASVGQPTRIGHKWRIIVGHSTFLTIHMLIHNKQWYMKMTNPSLSK